MNKQITTEVKTLVKEMAAWCIDNHTEEFMCDFHLTAHVNWLEIKLMSGGWRNGETFEVDGVTLTHEQSSEWLADKFEGMKNFKLWHDIEFKPENVLKKQEEKKKKKIESLKSQLLELEK
jgi:hypothetical protein